MIQGYLFWEGQREIDEEDGCFHPGSSFSARCWMCLLHLQLPGSSWLLRNLACQALCKQVLATRSHDLGPGSELGTQSQAAPRFRAANKAEAVAWVSCFLQKERVDAECSCLVWESGVKTGGKCPGCGMAGCVLVVPVVRLGVPQVLVLSGGNEREALQCHGPSSPNLALLLPACATCLGTNTATRQGRAGQPRLGLAVLGLPFSFWRVGSEEQGLARMQSPAYGHSPSQGKAQTCSVCRFSKRSF